MDTNIELRRATLEDAAAMAVLSGQLGYPVSEAEVAERISTLLRAREAHAIFVAAHPAGLTGWLHVMRVDRIESPPHGEIAALVVGEMHRGKGIGAQLVSAAIEWTQNRGLACLTVRSRIERNDAHRFYQQMGFGLEKTQRVMKRVL